MSVTTLTKDQVRKLTTEQQEALASAVVVRDRARQQLLARARRGMSGWAMLWMAPLSILPVVWIAFPRLTPFAGTMGIVVAIAGVIAYVNFHMTRVYKRMDAMMELHDEDMKRVTERERSDDHAA